MSLSSATKSLMNTSAEAIEQPVDAFARRREREAEFAVLLFVLRLPRVGWEWVAAAHERGPVFAGKLLSAETAERPAPRGCTVAHAELLMTA